MKIYFLFSIIIIIAVIGIIGNANKTLIVTWEIFFIALTSIGTLALAGVTFFMVTEMRETRIANMKPEIIITDPLYRYEFRWIPKEKLSPIIRPELKEGEPNRYETRLPVFGIKNIGQAPALEIFVNWEICSEIDTDVLLQNSFIKAFNPIFKEELFCLSQETTSGEDGSGFRCIPREQTYVPYCVVSSTDDTIHPLPMPEGISGFFDLTLMIQARPKDCGIIVAVPIRVNVSYEDVEGRKYHKGFIIDSTLYFLPDYVSSDRNSVDSQHFSDKNIRGTIRFHVIPENSLRNNHKF